MALQGRSFRDLMTSVGLLLGMLEYVANVFDGQSAIFAWLKVTSKPGHDMTWSGVILEFLTWF